VTDDALAEPYYDPDRREIMRQTMIAEGFMPNMPMHELSDVEWMQIDNRLMMEDQAVEYGGINEMLDTFEREMKTAKSYDSVEAFMASLHETKPDQK
jgi:hypothetical protein